jgi:hypothetical protein
MKSLVLETALQIIAVITSNIFIATTQMRNEDTVLHGTTSALKGSKNLPKTL